MDIFLTILIIAAASAVLWLILSYICWHIAFRRGKFLDLMESSEEGSPYRRHQPEISEAQKYVSSLPYEKVSIVSKDGLHLVGKLYSAKDQRALILMFHGYRAKAENDYGCAFRYYLEHGFSLLLVDQRAHGQSEGRTMSFGVMERWDCLFWAKWADEHFPGLPLVLEGMSMGSATVLMAAELSLPQSVCGIIADCGYTSPKAIIKKVIHDMHLPTALVYPFVCSGAEIFGRFSLNECDAPSSLKKCSVPVLLIHGEDDTFVPCSMSRENYDACPGKKRLITVPGAEHGLSYLEDKETVQSAIADFLDDVTRGRG